MATNSRFLASLPRVFLFSTRPLFTYTYLRCYQALDLHSGQTPLFPKFIRTTEEQPIQRPNKHDRTFLPCDAVSTPGYQFSVTTVRLYWRSYFWAEIPVECQGWSSKQSSAMTLLCATALKREVLSFPSRKSEGGSKFQRSVDLCLKSTERRTDRQHVIQISITAIPVLPVLPVG